MEYFTVTFIIVVVYLIMNLTVGILARRGEVEIKEKLVGWAVASRRLGMVVLFFITGAGAISAYTFLGAPGWAYSKGAPILYVVTYLTLGYFVAYFMAEKIWKAGRVFDYVAQSQVFSRRFESDLVGALAAVIGTLGCIGYGITQGMGYGYIMEFSSGGQIPFWVGVIIINAIMLLYILTAGLKGIGWASSYQGIMMFIIAWVAGPLIIYRLVGGGFGTLFTQLAEKVPESLTLMGGGWNYAFWTTSVIVCSLGIVCWPTFWTSWMGSGSIRVLKRTVAVLPLYWFIILPMIVVGWAGRLVMPGVTPTDTIAMVMAKAALPAWLTGLLFAATLAAAMSSAALLPFTAGLLFTTSVISPFTSLSEKGRLQLSKIMTLVFTAIIVGVSIFKPETLVGMLLKTYGWLVQLFPVIIATFYWPRATKYGAASGLAIGLLVSILCGSNPYGIHAGMWGLFANTLALVIVSYLTKPPEQEAIQEFTQL
ncbi:MAG: sodium:solute symporter family protein [Candidatus Heimdallarchaeaceae archaeon]